MDRIASCLRAHPAVLRCSSREGLPGTSLHSRNAILIEQRTYPLLDLTSDAATTQASLQRRYLLPRSSNHGCPWHSEIFRKGNCNARLTAGSDMAMHPASDQRPSKQRQNCTHWRLAVSDLREGDLRRMHTPHRPVSRSGDGRGEPSITVALLKISESMGNHDSKIVDASSVVEETLALCGASL